MILKHIYRFFLKTVILSGQIYIPGTRDIPGDLVFILPARYIASALYGGQEVVVVAEELKKNSKIGHFFLKDLGPTRSSSLSFLLC